KACNVKTVAITGANERQGEQVSDHHAGEPETRDGAVVVFGASLRAAAGCEERSRLVAITACHFDMVPGSGRLKDAEGGIVGGKRLLQTRRPALPLPEHPKREAEVVLRHRPLERHTLARPLLERRA